MRISRLWLAVPVAAGLLGVVPATATAQAPPPPQPAPTELHLAVLRIGELLKGHLLTGVAGAHGHVNVPPTIFGVLDWVRHEFESVVHPPPPPSRPAPTIPDDDPPPAGTS